MPEINLPRQRTAFIGRQHDLEDIARQLRTPTCQLLTLTGPGGIGKTRLALEVAFRLQDIFADGAYFIPLAPLASANEIPTVVIGALPLQPYGYPDPEQQLLDYLSTKQMLLVMDNFEHVLEGSVLVGNIIDVAAQVKVLATSREALNLQEEWLWHVQGMAVPDENTDQIEGYSAVQLFLDRAQRVRHDFSLADEHEQVVRICQLVAGMPLALEMAAAWRKSLPCQAIADQIEHNLDFLTASSRNASDRHRSIRAVFDHSWQLLSERERAVFARLSVFRGGFTIEAAERVAGATLDNLTALADKSLIQPGVERYDIHELLRQYGDEKDADDRDRLHEAHATYFAHFVRQREDDLKGRRQKAALDEIALDCENVRTAWAWAVQADRYDLVNQMLIGTDLFFYMRDRFREFDQLRQMALTHFQLRIDQNDPNLWPLLVMPSYGIVLSTKQESHHPQHDQTLQTLALVEQQGRQALMATGLKTLGHVYEGQSDFQSAIHYYEQSLAHFQQLDDRFYMSWLLQRLGECYAAIGQWDQGYERSQRCLAICRQIGNRLHAARALYAQGMYALYHTCDLGRAHQDFEESVVEQREIENPMGVALATVELSYIAFLQGDVDTVTPLVAEVLTIADAISRPEIQSAGLALQALLAALNGDDATGHRLARQCLEHMRIQYPITVFWAQLALVMAGHGQNAPGERHQGMSEMLPQAAHVKSPLLYACCLPFAALRFAHEGHFERAVELLALAASRLSEAAGWLERWQPLVRLRQQLENALGVDRFAIVWKHGAQLNLDMTIAVLADQTDNLGEFQPSLVEPLSARELEILHLIAEDLSNREIAERLYLTVGTVKSHNNHIFSKLGVKNRTEAVIHARTLGLLP